jgi:23S rRNA (uracil1939-C5)-methyltransferase
MAMKKRLLQQSGALEPAETKAGSLDEPAIAEIESLGAQGDGVARIGGTPVHIPFTLPGEIVRVRLNGNRGTLAAVETTSPARRTPVCRHFGACGSCALQHWQEASYNAWKLNLVNSALARARVGAALDSITSYPAASRRRAAFTARNFGGRIELGYRAARSHDLVDLAECAVVLPAIAEALPFLRQALTACLSRGSEARVRVTAAANGLDCWIEGPELAASDRARLPGAFSAGGMIRVSWNGETVFMRSVPVIFFGGAAVQPPQDAFLQAVEACERDIADFVIQALSGSKAGRGPVCDLFAGLGAFTFPCAKTAPVTAYEMNPQAVAALTAAAREAKGIKPVAAIRRDLFRNPLSAVELNRYSAVIIDPPREGAEAQCRALAASKVETVVMLSCDPTTFAADAAQLIKGGYQLLRAAAFDQFKYSAHVEMAAHFQRPRVRKK